MGKPGVRNVKGVRGYCLNKRESCFRFRTDFTSGNRAYFASRPGKLGRGSRELVSRMRNCTGRGQVCVVFGGAAARTLLQSVIGGIFSSFLLSLSSGLSLCFPSPPHQLSADTGSRLDLLNSGHVSLPPFLPSEVNESEISQWFVVTPAPSADLCSAKNFLVWLPLSELLGSGTGGRARLGRLPCHGGMGDVTLLYDTRDSLVTWEPTAEAVGEKRLGLGFPAPRGNPALVWLVTFGQVRWPWLLVIELCGRLKVCSGSTSLADCFFLGLIYWSCEVGVGIFVYLQSVELLYRVSTCCIAYSISLPFTECNWGSFAHLKLSLAPFTFLLTSAHSYSFLLERSLSLGFR